MTEREARESGADVRVYKVEMSEVDRAVVDRTPRGFVKFVCDAKGRILGAHALCANASTLIEEIVLARKQGLKIGQLASLVSPYPSLADAVQKSASLYYQRLSAGWLGALARRVALRTGLAAQPRGLSTQPATAARGSAAAGVPGGLSDHRSRGRSSGRRGWLSALQHGFPRPCRASRRPGSARACWTLVLATPAGRLDGLAPLRPPHLPGPGATRHPPPGPGNYGVDGAQPLPSAGRYSKSLSSAASDSRACVGLASLMADRAGSR